MAASVYKVFPGSIADELEIEAGDILLTIDENPINDILDYQFYSREDNIVMEIEKPNGDIWAIEIEKDYDDDLGLIFDDIIFDQMKQCKNRCIFCFVDQLPRKMRKTLYVKDDDYRLSFLTGNFITLTNLSRRDWDKIINMRLSPLYISVHCLQPELRSEMLGHPGGANIRHDLERLAQASIEVHTQIVLCPGINDGRVLEDTISGLAEYYPSVKSIGIVPVGLTAHRAKLPHLKIIDRESAREIIALVDTRQEYYRKKYGIGMVYLADEFYINAGIEFPSSDYYDDYPQIENGIGLARTLLDEFKEISDKLPGQVSGHEVYIVSGKSAESALEPIIKELNSITGVEAELLTIRNDFFSGNVTVTGLLTGCDIIKQLGKRYEGKDIVLPSVLLKEHSRSLLDDITIADIEKETGTRVLLTDGSARSLVDAVLGIQTEDMED
ncbi:MAG: DUF512 domain-containing protein [Syntrophomonadaceae bacterium]|nr:DUF512 domain-containing protein [Syntrophomonadaceae bacterium]